MPFRKTLFSICLGVGVLCFLNVPSAHAAVAPGVITGCVGNLTGFTRIVGSPHDCINGLETVVQWNSAGPSGVTGSTGAMGVPGPAGAPGTTGAMGLPGATGTAGVAGAAGATGAAGAAGVAGATGAAGIPGVAGATGAMGATGAVGTPGLAGATGAAGATGLAGTTGIAGATGAVGATGIAGATGAVGATGIAGATGAVGASGIAGATGAAGATGIAGATGVAGRTGATGVQGVAGVAGSDGATGAQGAAGANGGLVFSSNFALPGTLTYIAYLGPASGVGSAVVFATGSPALVSLGVPKACVAQNYSATVLGATGTNTAQVYLTEASLGTNGGAELLGCTITPHSDGSPASCSATGTTNLASGEYIFNIVVLSGEAGYAGARFFVQFTCN